MGLTHRNTKLCHLRHQAEGLVYLGVFVLVAHDNDLVSLEEDKAPMPLVHVTDDERSKHLHERLCYAEE